MGYDGLFTQILPDAAKQQLFLGPSASLDWIELIFSHLKIELMNSWVF
jgi:hypothetical protein